MRRSLRLLNSIGVISVLVFAALALTIMTSPLSAEREACPQVHVGMACTPAGKRLPPAQP